MVRRCPAGCGGGARTGTRAGARRARRVAAAVIVDTRSARGGGTVGREMPGWLFCDECIVTEGRSISGRNGDAPSSAAGSAGKGSFCVSKFSR